jgi:hypothetical protein
MSIKAKSNAGAKPIHGMSKQRVYKIWKGMRARCESPKRHEYQDYGGRGIYVCKRWGNFESFFLDMGDCPTGSYLDRINNDGPYSKENCRWATSKQSARNRRNSRLVAYKGETRCLTEWCELLGLHYPTIKMRVYVSKWDEVKALTFPISKGGRLTKLGTKTQDNHESLTA